MSILLIRFGGIGDVLLDTPLIRECKKLFDEPLYYLTSRVPGEVLELNPNLQGVLHIDEYDFPSLIMKVRNLKPSVVLDLQHNFKSYLLTLLSGAEKKVGLRKHGIEMYNIPVIQDFKKPYTVHHRMDFLKPFGLGDNYSTELELHLEDERIARMGKWVEDKGSEFKVLLHPLSGNSLKNWGLRNYIELSELLIDKHGASIFWSSHPSDRPLISKLIEGRKGHFLPPPTYNLRDIGALLLHMDLYLGADTGIKHMAVALGVPTFTIFTVAPPEVWTPPTEFHGFYRKETRCKPCWSRNKCPLSTYECLSMKASEVFETLEKFLKNHPVISKVLGGSV